MSSPYPLQENDEYSYEFITETGIRYLIYFLDYTYMFLDYPEINSSIYTFSIDAIEGDPDKSKGDEKVGATVSWVLNLFFKKVDNVAVYVCDSLDDRQYARKRKFDYWFNTCNDGSLIKEDGVAMVGGSEIYNAMILHKENARLKEIILAFKDLNDNVENK